MLMARDPSSAALESQLHGVKMILAVIRMFLIFALPALPFILPHKAVFQARGGGIPVPLVLAYLS